MRYLLGVLAAVIISAEGITKGRSLTRYVTFLDETLLFLDDIRCSIEYKEDTIEEIFSRYDMNDMKLPSFVPVCKEYMKHFDFPYSWKKSVSEIVHIKNADRKILYELGSKLGTTDKNSQIRLIDYNISRLQRSFEINKDIEKKNKRLYSFMGVASGLLIMLLII